MSRLVLFSFALALILATSVAFARGDGYSAGVVNDAGEEGVIFGTLAAMYDTCVQQHAIDGDGRSAVGRFQNYITKIRIATDGQDPVQRGKLADTVQQGFDVAKQKISTMGDLNKEQCNRAAKGWPLVVEKLKIE